MAHAPNLSFAAIATMSSVLIIYAAIKSPLKYQYASDNRLSPKADLAWRNAADKWLKEH
jgi:hypothetical protein